MRCLGLRGILGASSSATIVRVVGLQGDSIGGRVPRTPLNLILDIVKHIDCFDNVIVFWL